MKFFKRLSLENTIDRLKVILPSFAYTWVYITLLGIYWIANIIADIETDSFEQFRDMSIALIFGVIISYGLGILKTRGYLSHIKHAISQGVALLIIILTINLIPGDYYDAFGIEIAIGISALIGVILGLFLTLPQHFKTDETQIWNYYWKSFTRVILVGFCASVLFQGVMIAMFASNALFQTEFFSEKAFSIWFALILTIEGLVITTVLPQDFTYLKEKVNYPTFLRVFVNWITMPLLVIYLLILTLWAFVSVIRWDWNGISVVYTSLGLIIPSMIAIALFSQQRLEGAVRKWAFRAANIGLLVTLISYFLAIWIRINEYGFTVNRYTVMMLGVFILGYALYNIFSKQIKFTTYALAAAVLILISTITPFFNAYRLSTESQLQRYKDIFADNGLEINDQQYEYDWSEQDEIDLSSIVYYLDTDELADLHGYDDVRNPPDILDKIDAENRGFGQLNLNNPFDQSVQEIYYDYTYDVLNIDGYQYLIQGNSAGSLKTQNEIIIDDQLTIDIEYRSGSVFFDGREVTRSILYDHSNTNCGDDFTDKERFNRPECSPEPLKIDYEKDGLNISLGIFLRSATVDEGEIKNIFFDLAVSYKS